MSHPVVSAPNETKSGWPKGIPFIVGNEAAERFSFYGMKAILFVYLRLLMLNFDESVQPGSEAFESASAHAREVVHLFNAGVYAFPILGAVLADRLFGKYNVIMWLSVVYCAGHAVLAFAQHTMGGMMLGLTLIAIGSGGIKPCVSAIVGDQFGAHNSHLVTKVYQIFYFSINFGSFFSTMLTPVLMRKYGPDVAFGVPGILMAVATFVFWLGRKTFVHVAPKPGGKLGALDAIATTALFTPVAMFLFGDVLEPWLRVTVGVVGVVVWYSVFQARQKMQEDTGFFSVLLHRLKHGPDATRAHFGDELADGPSAVFRIGVVFSMVTIFWALFDQHGSSWVDQATRMDLSLPSWLAWAGDENGHIDAQQVSSVNPIFVMMIIPLLNVTLYPLLGDKFTPLRRMSVGMFIGAFAFAWVAIVQRQIDDSPAGTVGVMNQMGPYFLMTLAEVFVSVTGLEFAYTQAPRAMKSTMMSFWLLTVSFGNKLVAVLSGFEGLPLQKFFWIFAGLMALAAAIFSVLAYFYKGKTYLQSE